MIYDKHAVGRVEGVPYAAAVVEFDGVHAVGYLYSNPDTSQEWRAKWEADLVADATPPRWSVLIGGVRDLVDTAGYLIIVDALRNYEKLIEEKR